MYQTQSQQGHREHGNADRLMLIAVHAYLADYFESQPERVNSCLGKLLSRIETEPVPASQEDASALLDVIDGASKTIWTEIFSDELLTRFVQNTLPEKGMSAVRMCGWLAALQRFEATYVCTAFPDHEPSLPNVARPSIFQKRCSPNGPSLEDVESSPSQSSLEAAYATARSAIVKMLRDDTSLPPDILLGIHVRNIDIDENTLSVQHSGQSEIYALSKATSLFIADFIPLRYRYLTSLAPGLWRIEKRLLYFDR